MPFGSFLPVKTPAAKLRAAMHKHRDLSASTEINLPRTFTRRAGRRKARQKNVWVHNFLFCQVINAKPLEIVFFYICHTFLRLDKLSHLPNQLCKTVEDAGGFPLLVLPI
jgi:hypothetical protein